MLSSGIRPNEHLEAASHWSLQYTYKLAVRSLGPASGDGRSSSAYSLFACKHGKHCCCCCGDANTDKGWTAAGTKDSACGSTAACCCCCCCCCGDAKTERRWTAVRTKANTSGIICVYSRCSRAAPVYEGGDRKCSSNSISCCIISRSSSMCS